MNNRIILNALRFQLAYIESEADDIRSMMSTARYFNWKSEPKKPQLNRISHLNRRKAKIVATIKEIKHA